MSEIDAVMIVEEWLYERGAEGLCNDSCGCACGLGGISPDCCMSGDCKPAKSAVCPECGHVLYVPAG